MAAKKDTPPDPEDRTQDAEFVRAFEMLQGLVDWAELDRLHPTRGNAVYSTSVVLWMLVFQRMNSDSTLEAAVKMFIETKPSFIRPNKRVEENTVSPNTGGFSRARSRVDLESAYWLHDHVAQSLVEATEPSFEGRRAFLVDGTTMTLAPEPELQKKFPPATNQLGASIFPTALLVVAHELASGIALRPTIGAKYGENAVSETALFGETIQRLPEDAIVIADAGFGIFWVAWEAKQARRDFLLRMTKQRFMAVCRNATLVERGADFTTYSHKWVPSAKERKSHPDLPAGAVLEVLLHEVDVHKELTLHLVSGMPHSANRMSDLYLNRVNVEVDIRNVKVVLNTEGIAAKSEDMFMKELLMSMVAYNLVTQFRRQAAKMARVPPRRLSFKRTWTTFKTFLWSHLYTGAVDCRTQYRRALNCAMKDKLPNRPGRSFAREAYHKRHKSVGFKKRQRKNAASEQDP
jgi:hypothetical protein